MNITEALGILNESVEADAKSVVDTIVDIASRHRSVTDKGELAGVLQDLVKVNKEIKPRELTQLAFLLDFINDMSKSAVTGKSR